MASFRDPINIGKVQLRNRLAVAPTMLMFADPEGYVTQKNLDHYEELARGGWGFITVEATYIRQDGQLFRHMQSMKTDRHMQGLKEIAYVIHLAGVKCSLQIMHSGRQSALTYRVHGLQSVAPSPVPFAGITPRALTTKECAEMTDLFAACAAKSEEAGFDAVTFHACNGFLIQQFMSPWTNKRTDRYGDRLAFVTEMVGKSREAVSPDFPLIIRLAADELLGDKGIIPEWVAEEAVPALEEAGVDCFDITAGCLDTASAISPPLYQPRGLYMKYTEMVKQHTELPVIGVGRVNDPRLAESVIARGSCDIISFCRQSIADPYFAKKMLAGEYEEVRKCLACETCGATGSIGLGYVKCPVNPELGRAKEYRLQPTKEAKKVLVIGGGVAGLEAAMVAAQRGHDVTLWEKGAEMGGTVTRVAAALPRLYTRELRNLPDWLVAQLGKLGVKVELGKEATVEAVAKEAPDVVIMATGSRPTVADIPGAEKSIVTNIDDYVTQKAKVGKRVVVIGGRHGAEVAVSLARQKKEVTILEEGGEEVLGITPYIHTYAGRRTELRAFIEEDGIKVLSEVEVREIVDDGVVFVDKQGKKQKIEADTVLLAVGRTSNRELFDALSGRVREMYDIGDCREPRNMLSATHEAAYIAREI